MRCDAMYGNIWIYMEIMNRISGIHVDPAIMFLLPSEKHLILRKPKLRISLPGEKVTDCCHALVIGDSSHFPP